jgi:uncharacterized protein (TIGR02466 family)
MAKMTTKKKSKLKKESPLEVSVHFPCTVYLIEKPEFLETINKISEESLEASRKEQEVDEIYPVVMSGNYYDDPRLDEFAEYIGSTAWNILSEQGYDMQNLSVGLSEMWTQEHHKHSSMEQHVHGAGLQIIGFYFLETPENCSKVVFHDPRPGKVQIDLPEQNMYNVTQASKMVNFQPKPGLLMFANSWLPHSFSKHASDEPIKFVHFNLTVVPAQQNYAAAPSAEVI